MVYAIFIFLILLEVAWDSYHEVKLNKSPNYQGSNLIRMIAGTVLWIGGPNYQHMTLFQWWIFPLTMFITFWFLFDWGLNIARCILGKKTPYWYLGEKSKLDLWQRNHGGAFLWFWIKLSATVFIWTLQIGIV